MVVSIPGDRRPQGQNLVLVRHGRHTYQPRGGHLPALIRHESDEVFFGCVTPCGESFPPPDHAHDF